MLDYMKYRDKYEYRDGVLVFASGAFKGRVAGRMDRKGYRRLIFSGMNFSHAKMVWVIHNGEIPEGLEIDHIDRDPSNDAIENLRLVTRRQNCLNSIRKPTPHNPIPGVFYFEERGRPPWIAQISINGKRTRLGRFNTQQEAIDARRAAETTRQDDLVYRVRPGAI